MCFVLSMGWRWRGMFTGKGKKFIAEYQSALDRMSKASTEYVRGIPVVKVFQQTVYSFTTLKRAIDEYSAKAEQYQGEVCAVPQSVNLSFIKAAFVFLIPVTILLVPGAIASGDLAGLVSDFAFYAIFSALISTALSKIMFAAGGMMQASDAMGRIDEILSAPQISVPQDPQVPADNSIEFRNVGFAYEGDTRRTRPGVVHGSRRLDRRLGGTLGRWQDDRREPYSALLGR